MPGYTAPFEVPTDIVDTQRDVVMNGTALSSFVNVGDGT
jgi:hypothetical protein